MINAISRDNDPLTQIFPTIVELHVYSEGPLIILRQGDQVITFHRALAGEVVHAVVAAGRGEL